MTTASTARPDTAPGGPAPRAHRTVRRILVVDARPTALSSAIREVLRPQNGAVVVDAVPSYLSALGDVAARPADLVIGPIDPRDGMMAAVARALGRIAPQARLLVTIDPGEEADAAEAMQVGVSDYLTLPPDPEEIARLAGLAVPGRKPPEAVSADSPPSASANRNEPRVRSESAALGDIDLVDAVMLGQGLAETALQIVTDRSGLLELGLTDDPASLPDEHVTAEIRRADGDLGHLHAPPQPGTDALSAWADWLGHWLALDRHVRQLKQLAMTDELTRVWNRRYFDQFLRRILSHAADDRSQVTVMVFDIDDFKRYNDRFGHAAGDEILRETAKLMQTVVREHDVVARIGGDEFAVIFWDAEPPRRPNQKPDSRHPQDVLHAAKRFQAAVCRHQFPKLLDTAPGTLTISGGLASFPWDGRSPEELLERADAMALRSKQQGKNAITLGPGAMRRCNTPQETA